MNDIAVFECLEQKLTRSIDIEVKRLRSQNYMSLPRAGTAVISHYQALLKLSCSLERVRKESDSAVELLYIAYNATPKSYGDIRVRISKVMCALMLTQQDTERALSKGLRSVDAILAQLWDFFPDWQELKESRDIEGLEDFVACDLRELVSSIQRKAARIQSDLYEVSGSYRELISDTEVAAKCSEQALSLRLVDRADIEQELLSSRLRSQKLEHLGEKIADRFAALKRFALSLNKNVLTSPEQASVNAIVDAAQCVVEKVIPASTESVAVEEPEVLIAECTSIDELLVLQSQVFDLAEAYEYEKSIHAKELVSIQGLLGGDYSKQNAAKLALKSLNESLYALKQNRDIAYEIGRLFEKTTSDLERTINHLFSSHFPQMVDGADEFFIRQCAKWNAVMNIVSGLCQNFGESWKKVSQIKGNSISGDDLTAYFSQASKKLNALEVEREKARTCKVACLANIRSRLTTKAG